MSEEAINRAVRRTRKARPLGLDAKCWKCGCADLTALHRPKYKKKIWCYECASLEDAKSAVEEHHLLGKANDPETTAGVLGNLHRPLSDAQIDWPQEVRYNTERDPLVWIAGLLYSLHDIFCVLASPLKGAADFLVWLSRLLRRLLSSTWWLHYDQDLSWMGGAAA
jgi:hypothetical protein